VTAQHSSSLNGMKEPWSGYKNNANMKIFLFLHKILSSQEFQPRTAKGKNIKTVRIISLE
jgi:hypothetical protein